MNEYSNQPEDVREHVTIGEQTGAEIISSWLKDKIFLGMDFTEYFKNLINPLNIAAGAIVFAGIFLILVRFIFGLD